MKCAKFVSDCGDVLSKQRLLLVLAKCLLVVGVYSGQARAEATVAQEEMDYSYAPLFSAQVAKRFEPKVCSLIEGNMLYWVGESVTFNCGVRTISFNALAGKGKKKPPEGEEGVAERVRIRLADATFTAETILRGLPNGFIDYAWSADLNGDGKEDYIIELGSHGNGLAAETCSYLFLLSDAKGYRYTEVSEAMQTQPSPILLQFGGNPTPVMLLQRMAKSSNGSDKLRGQDGKSHVFFKFDLLQFDPATPRGVKVSNQLDSRFPFWTQFTEKPSHAATNLLSESVKRAEWRDPMKNMDSVEMKVKAAGR
ncbi:MAG: hypothetical protein PHH47_13395 [Gallionella sp.]|nr:hypothetical protein [Gallionella sp.]MDD4946530.1 hypothetical protein [Gallionella sp.]